MQDGKAITKQRAICFSDLFLSFLLLTSKIEVPRDDQIRVRMSRVELTNRKGCIRFVCYPVYRFQVERLCIRNYHETF